MSLLSGNRKTSKRFSLMQKLTMLVAFPLVFEFIFVFSLAALLLTAQADTKRIQQAKETQSSSGDIMQSVFRLVSTGFLYSLKQDATVLETYNHTKNNLGPQLKVLRQSCVDDETAKRSSEKVSVLAYRLVDDLDVLAETPKSAFDAYISTASKIGYVTRLIMRECERISNIQARVHPNPTSNTDWQTIIYGVLAAGIAFSVIASAGALKYVHLDLLQRISQMVNNIDAIARRAPLGSAVSGSDELTELDKFIHATDDSLRQLEQSRQEFMSMLTHDMRAPLTQIQFSVALLADGTYEDDPEKRNGMLRTLVPEMARLNRLVDDLLTANKLDVEPIQLELEDVSSIELLSQIKDSMELESSSRARTITVSGDNEMVVADTFQIARVLTNLCANALKYTAAGTGVELSCRTEGDKVQFQISDHGPGIPEALVDRIFERYQQGKDDQARSGFGLGLYIAKSIVDAHGEKIWVENNSASAGGGCSFYFTLKRSEV